MADSERSLRSDKEADIKMRFCKLVLGVHDEIQLISNEISLQ